MILFISNIYYFYNTLEFNNCNNKREGKVNLFVCV